MSKTKASPAGLVAWNVPIPPIARKPFTVLCPPPGGQVKVIVVGRRPVVIGLHWMEDYTLSRPCTGEAQRCPYCADGSRPRVEGFLAAWEWSEGLCLVKLTLNALWSCAELRDEATELRGKQLVLKRHGRRPNGKITARLEPRPASIRMETLAEFDVQAALERIFFAGPNEARRAARAAQSVGSEISLPTEPPY